MTKRQLVAKELQRMPEPMLEEVLDFVEFLKVKTTKQKLALALLSESSLRKDWLKREEDTAWKSL